MRRSGKIDGVALQVLKRDDLERRLMGRCENDTRCAACLQRLAPARGAQAPAVAGLEPRKAKVELRRRQIVAARFGKFEELCRYLDDHRMQPEILRTGMTAPGAKKAGERALRAGLQRLAIDIPLTRHGLLLWPCLHSRDCARCRRGLEGSAGLAASGPRLRLDARLWRAGNSQFRDIH